MDSPRMFTGTQYMNNKNSKSQKRRLRRRRRAGGYNQMVLARPAPVTDIMTVKAPLASSANITTNRPRIFHSPNGDVRVSHREFLASLPGSVAWSIISTYNIQPGISFPWLSDLANLYETFDAINITFIIRTIKAASSPGLVSMAVDFDVNDPAPTDKVSFLSYYGSTSGPVWKELVYQLPAEQLVRHGTGKFTRYSGATGDQKLYDVGNLYIALEGCADTSVHADLFVEYTFDFHTPQRKNQSDNTKLRVNEFAGSGTARATPFNGYIPTWSFGDLGIIQQGSTITFLESGRYLLNHMFTGTVVTNTQPTYGGTATVVDSSSVDKNAGSTRGLFGVLADAIAGQTLTYDFSPSCDTLTADSTTACFVNGLAADNIDDKLATFW